MNQRRSGALTRRPAIPLAWLLVAVMVLLPAIPANAAVTCATAGVAVNVTLASGDSVTIGRNVAGTFSVSGTGLTPSTCGGSTVANRDTVNVTGTGGNESVTIDLTEGSFAPGIVNEAGTTDEIEFAIDLGAGSGDSLTVTGSAFADVITVGEAGINLNDVDDVDVTTAGVQNRTITGAGGVDELSAAGGNATGASPSTAATATTP